jgi:hypothetical protein
VIKFNPDQMVAVLIIALAIFGVILFRWLTFF